MFVPFIKYIEQLISDFVPQVNMTLYDKEMGFCIHCCSLTGRCREVALVVGTHLSGRCHCGEVAVVQGLK